MIAQRQIPDDKNDHTHEHRGKMRSSAIRYGLAHIGLLAALGLGDLGWHRIASTTPRTDDVLTLQTCPDSLIHVVSTNSIIISNVLVTGSQRNWTIRKLW